MDEQPNAVPFQVTEAARASVGQVIERVVGDPISRRQLREYLVGTDDHSTIYDVDDDATALPPLFFFAAMREVVYRSELDSDGQHRNTGVVGVSGRTLEGGTDCRLGVSARIGDVLTMERKLASIEEKVGRSGPMAIVVTETSFTNQQGETVADFTHTLVFR